MSRTRAPSRHGAPARHSTLQGFLCLDCSVRARHFPAGRCPGCGSLNVRAVSAGSLGQPRARKRFRISLATALWLLLAVEVWRRFFAS